MVVFPNAKINIGLCITGKRNDGYHNIESIFYPVPITDILEIVPLEEGDRFNFYGTKIEGDLEKNLIVKATTEMRKALILDYDPSKQGQVLKFSFHLQKIIPTGAGLGGGSADGTYTLKALNRLLDLNLKVGHMEEIALKLGSDCPFFVRNKPALVSGRGENVEHIDLDLSNYHLVLIHPGIHISTTEAYQNIITQPSKINWQSTVKKPISEWKNHLRNDFEKTIFEKHPEIKSIKEKLYEIGADYAQMSGSGSAVYGLFKDEKDKEFIQKEFKPSYSIFTCSFN